ncbi:hypothetical protein CAI16_11675 [Virgibacillus dokdonensis]|uniref:Uncharacterized protein n=1 Tax=Virgibacillus dokdonensis TaxID=302167 RepID=A0A3E0WN06_9BACI|nr:hypothetical protein CAI16_11675 [Virgibacillus dokdonensis]
MKEKWRFISIINDVVSSIKAMMYKGIIKNRLIIKGQLFILLLYSHVLVNRRQVTVSLFPSDYNLQLGFFVRSEAIE